MGEFKFYVIKHLWYFRNLVITASMSLSFHSESYHLEIMACKNLMLHLIHQCQVDEETEAITQVSVKLSMFQMLLRTRDSKQWRLSFRIFKALSLRQLFLFLFYILI